jgi:deoxyribonuclease-4
MSVAGGLHLSFERAAKVGCLTMQIFTRSERQWNSKPLSEAELADWEKARSASPVWPVLSHDSYLINLASPVDENWEKSVQAFKDEIYRCAALGIPYLVTHAGSHTGSGEEYALNRLVESLNRVIDECDHEGVARANQVKILLETTAGQGTAIGYKFEHWSQILEKLIQPERVGVCFDTCHVYAAGYDLTTPEGYEDTMEQFNKYIGYDKLLAFHVNDSKKGLGSRVDRHEHIGQGAIGLEAFRFLMNDARFTDVPKVLETPKGPEGLEDIENLARLRSLVVATS